MVSHRQRRRHGGQHRQPHCAGALRPHGHAEATELEEDLYASHQASNRTAVDFGRLPPEVFEVLDIQCEAPSIPYKSALDEAQANQIRVQGGWKSRQTVQQEEGLDPEREMQNIEEYNRRMGAAEKQGPAQVQEANFNPDEPRDERGRWTKDSEESPTAPAPRDEDLPWNQLLEPHENQVLQSIASPTPNTSSSQSTPQTGPIWPITNVSKDFTITVLLHGQNLKGPSTQYALTR